MEAGRSPERVEALYRSAGRFSRKLDLEGVLEAVCEETAGALHAPAAIHSFYDQASRTFRHGAASGLSKLPRKFVPAPRSVLERLVAEPAVVVVVPDLLSWPELDDKALIEELGLRSLAVAAVAQGSNLIGCLGVVTVGEPRAFTEEETDRLQGLAGLAAQAITNAQLFEASRRRAQRAELVASVAQALSVAGTDVRNLLATTVRRTAELLDGACVLALLSEDGSRLDPVASHDPDEAALETLPAEAEISTLEDTAGGGELAARVVETGRSVFIPDSTGSSRSPSPLPDYQPQIERSGSPSLLIVPLQAQGKAIGTLGLSREKGKDRFTREDQEFLAELADRAAMAVTNARLYEEARDRTGELSTLLSLATRMRKAQSPRELLPLALGEIRTLVGADGGAVALSEQDGGPFRFVQGVGHLEPCTGYCFEADEGACGAVRRTGQPLVLAGPGDGPGFPAGCPLGSELGPQAFIPLQSEAGLLGVLVVARSKTQTAKPFTRAEVRLLSTCGEMVGNALRRMLLFEDAKERAARQASILSALPARIALLDTQGRILSVNEAWRRYAGVNALQEPGFGIGLDYLAICDGAPGHEASEAHELAEGIRSVLTGAASSFSTEYPCGAPPDQSWFLTTVTPLAQDHPGGAVVMHFDVTAGKRAAQDLRESERRFSDLLRDVELASLMLDREARITYCNDYLLRLTGWRQEEVLGRNWFELFVPSEAQGVREYFDALLSGLADQRLRESEIVTRSGERRLIRWNDSLLRSGGGDVTGTASIGEDITEQKRAESRIRRLNRVSAMLSGINALIVRVRDREGLFREACRIAVEVGAFRMAWIGVADPQGPDGRVVAWYGGEKGDVEGVRLTALRDAPESDRPACRALRLLQPVICNDVASDPSVASIREDLLGKGHRAVGCFPLTGSGRPDAVLALFAGQAGTFDGEETRLLCDMADNISFALDHLEKGKRLNYLAYYDVLTGLANRTLFLERVAQYIRIAGSGGHELALFVIDLERFKSINDSLGQAAGDGLLRQVAQWLTRTVGDAGLLARVGADHFAVVVPELKQDGDAARLLEKWMEELLIHPFRLDGAVFRIAAKVGIARFPKDGANADALFRNAEAALKKAKLSGDRYRTYTQSMTETVAGKLTLENQLSQALERREFVLHYQPKVNLASGRLTGTEALIRWNDPRSGQVPPGRFIPILEETGLIHDVGRWALRRSIEDTLRWRAAGLPVVPAAVNMSPLQLRHRGFLEDIRQAIGIDPHAAAGLELEITESLIMEDVKHSIAALKAIRALGVRIAIDDFGTGFSSLSYLARLPVDTLKIDRSFVVDMTAGPEGLALVTTIINLAHSLKLKVVAEGVETEEQARLLRLLGCDEMQGFLVSRPVPVEVFETDFLRAAVPG